MSYTIDKTAFNRLLSVKNTLYNSEKLTMDDRRDLAFVVGLVTDEAAVQLTESELWAAQLQEWPDSIRISVEDVIEQWPEACGFDDDVKRFHTMRQIAWAIAQNKTLVFYRCGRTTEGGYRWRGARFGIRPEEYISGF